MQFLTLLGKKLKSEEVIELLELHDVSVVYDFDRFQEGMKDVYWASSRDQGFELRFNEEQILDVVFLYIVESSGFSSVDKSQLDAPLFSSYREAKQSFEAEGVEYVSSPSNDPNHEMFQRWIKGIFQGYSIHYEFADHTLAKVTMTLIA
ncbi:hypothetical protein EUZ85_18605 [Hahella sp. KA22]|uniref:hypothetical protein n=1 Tax=Hahella sp. KA22 TaxID=1628392 RepID=UPI000FDF48DF|nr:hypothetical protein [Hahella sp. KA22]AZZ92626.1 hypothetical protein ENC22_16030 [Hahella sp. KA22]QAY55999.1 hypothetical protein EUZ85_18605 [Hahella sp. KA22]